MATAVRIAVCTNRSPEAVAEALAALSAQAANGDLALVTSGLDAASVAAHGRAFDGPLLVEPRPGLSHARNRALSWAAGEGADVLAFVDDDAVAAAGWLDALRRRWDEAPPEVACIGGPIRPRWRAPRPAWLADEIAPALTLLDRGGEVEDLDLSTGAAAYGANVSFRVEPLRRAGGFDPALGHAGARTFFSEEDEAQRALARLGYRTRYVPDAPVEHVIGPERLTRAWFLRRRFRYGMALARRGGRTRRLAAVQLVRTVGGALVAAAAGDGALAMTRAVRAAENAGALITRRPSA